MELEFDHVGLITNEKKKDENLVESTKVWVTNPKEHPFRIEWLRYEPDSPVKGPVREKPHIAFRVKSCLLYTSPSPRDLSTSRMPSSA